MLPPQDGVPPVSREGVPLASGLGLSGGVLGQASGAGIAIPACVTGALDARVVMRF